MDVKAWEEKISIPTYRTGTPDKNPMFLEKRVYQGSSGVVYPYQVIDKVYDEKEDKEWTALYLENDYLKVMILPELGGRIQMAYDKTNDYHFVYYNQVIKPALVGLTGPWISGGIEFNWPQHHRPTTFDATDYSIADNDNGSKTIWVNEYEMMYGTKCALGFTLHPDKAYIELQAKIYNRTPFPQTFLWWANPAVAVDEHYQSVFPPDVHAVYDHGKRAVSSFPVATGTYYKVDYSPGTDISVYTNIPVPTSYMAVNSAFDFVGGYHHKKKAGLMHIANHHISPGKKQWTWGCGDFGKAWDKQLTDEDGPYFELMCGMYTDNQPDFSWIMPDEMRIFTQYFMPYKNIGAVKNASIDALVNLESTEDKIRIQVYTTSKRKVIIQLYAGAELLLNEAAILSPSKTFEAKVPAPIAGREKQLHAVVTDEQNNILVSYSPVSKQAEALPEPATPIPFPAVIATNEELFLAGQHLEQYRHATYDPVAYYDEALKRDGTDLRCNNAKGLWLLRRGAFEEAETYFRKAVEKLTKHNPNPYDSEPLYNLGLCLKYRQQYDAAYDYLFKSTWSAAQQDVAYLQLACIAAIRGQWSNVAALAQNAILKNYNSLKARHIQSIALRKLNRITAAIQLTEETLSIDGFDFASMYELALCRQLAGNKEQAAQLINTIKKQIQHRSNTYIEIANQYADAGLYTDAINFLQLNETQTDALSLYYQGYFALLAGNGPDVVPCFERAFAHDLEKGFPNRIEDMIVLKTAALYNPKDYKALYYLGNFYYAKRLYDKARTAWETAVVINDHFPTTLRNLGIAYFNKFNKKEEALRLYERAFAADPTDARILLELDQLKKRFNIPPAERLVFLEQHFLLVNERDDLYIEFISLKNLLKQFNEAYELLMARNFHPWEGGEGKTAGQYILSLVEQSKTALSQMEPEKAKDLLMRAQTYPDNLGEGKIFGAQENDIFYWLGRACKALGATTKAQAYWEKASHGLNEPAQAVYYNDQQPDKIFYQALALSELGKKEEANARFNQLVQYGQQHENDAIKIDFFAVSLPDLMTFDDDLNIRNKVHCNYLMGLGYKGLGNASLAQYHLQKVLDMDPYHTGASLHLDLKI